MTALVGPVTATTPYQARATTMTGITSHKMKLVAGSTTAGIEPAIAIAIAVVTQTATAVRLHSIAEPTAIAIAIAPVAAAAEREG